ncbi:MAG TPA: CsgG/HfaB family protein [Bryobacteraceae bacterium]|nr:CsgG/HfaB family protein [Bryobacteraceae bacterium]
MKRFAGLLLLISVFISVSAAQKKRVAVMNFDYATVHNSVLSIWGYDQDIGKGIADLLVDKLVTDGQYSVIERKALDKVLAEQNFSNSDRADPSSAAKLGKVLGVDAIIIGSITQFGRDDKKTGVGGGAFGGFGRKVGIGGLEKKEAKAVVGISARMVNTETAEILAVATGKGESMRSGTSLVGAGAGGGSGGGGGVDMSSSNFGATILGEAVHSAVDDVAKQLDSKAGSLPARTVTIDGLVADASGGTIIANVGSRAGVKVGDRLEVRRKIREVKDPSTGKVIKRVEDKIGEMVVTEVDDLSCTGKFTGAGPAKVGDTVRNPQ